MDEVLDLAHLGSSLSLRTFARLGSSLATVGLTRFGSSLSVLDFVHLGSALSLRSVARMGSAVAVVGLGRSAGFQMFKTMLQEDKHRYSDHSDDGIRSISYSKKSSGLTVINNVSFENQ